MQIITPLWQDVLTNHLNRLYQQEWTNSDLLFSHNPHYPLRERVKVIDVSGVGIYQNMNVFQIVPYNVSDYFSGVPLIIHAEHPLSGEELLEQLTDRYGIVFDSKLDVLQSFVVGQYAPGEDVEIVIAPTSFIWEGKFTVRLRESTNDLNYAVRVRDLDALIIPDIIEPDTQSLKLILTPVVIKDVDVRRAFTNNEEVLMTGALLDKLMIDIVESAVIDPEYYNELFTVLNGQTFVNTVVTEDVLIESHTTSPLRSEHFSGTPTFTCEPYTQKPNLSVEIPPIDMSTFKLQDSQWRVYTGPLNTQDLSIVEELLKLAVETGNSEVVTINDIITSIHSEGVEGVFEGYSGHVMPEDYDTGKTTILLRTAPNSPYSGSIRLEYPVERFVVHMEKGKDFFQAENSDPIELEAKRYILAEEELPFQSHKYRRESHLGRVTVFSSLFLDQNFVIQDTVTVEDLGKWNEYTSSVNPVATVREPKEETEPKVYFMEAEAGGTVDTEKGKPIEMEKSRTV